MYWLVWSSSTNIQDQIKIFLPWGKTTASTGSTMPLPSFPRPLLSKQY